MNSPDNAFERRARALYREAGQQLDPAILDRLRTARRAALQAARAPSRTSRRLLLPAGAFAAVAMAVLVVWQPTQPGASGPAQAIEQGQTATEADGDLPPDADSADPNLYQNLDFYGWLASSDGSRQDAR